MKIIKIKDYDNEGGATATEAEKLLKKGQRLLTPDEWMDLTDKEIDDLYAYRPVLLKTKGGLLARGSYGLGDYDSRRGVYADYRPSGRFGVLAVKEFHSPKLHKKGI